MHLRVHNPWKLSPLLDVKDREGSCYWNLERSVAAGGSLQGTAGSKLGLGAPHPLSPPADALHLIPLTDPT